MFNRISVIGLGYIGLPTAAMIASKRKDVVGVDNNTDTVEIINSAKVHIVEPNLHELVESVVNDGYLKATTVPIQADAFIIAVPTPFKKLDSSKKIPEPDISFIKSAAKNISKVLKKGDLVILESTSPVGTTEKLSEWLSEYRDDLTFPHHDGESSDVRIAYCPERVLPGKIINELVTNDRVIGGITNKCSKEAKELYKIFVKGKCLMTNSRTAEMVKLSENAFRDVNIAFANELSILCDINNVSSSELISLANRHPRVNILNPGPGVGGHCIAVDPWFLAFSDESHSKIIQTARYVNNYKKKWVIEKIIKYINNAEFNNPNIAILGLSFKPDIDDLRGSPAFEITKELIKYGFNILPVEPNINYIDNLKLYSISEALEQADIAVKLVAHSEFRELDIRNIKFINFVEDIN